MKTELHPLYKDSHARRIRTAEALTSAMWISISLVVALFLADRGIAEMTQTQAGLWTGIGQITGLVGTNLLLIQLILASRMPWIDRSVGHDKAMELHKKLGKPVLILIAFHALALTIGYALSDKLNFIAEIFNTLSLPDMLFAWAGFGLLLVIVISSLVIVRRKLDYDVWFIIHLLAYLAVVASIPHQFQVGEMFAEGTKARWYWILLYSFAGASILIFRFITPVVLSLRHSLVVSDIRYETDDVATITLTGKEIHRLSAKTGQFFMWRFWAKGLWWHAHPFSLSAAPTGNSLRITIRALGNGSEQIGNIEPGTRASIEGPYGLFTDAVRTSRRLVLIGAGIGITPIRALLEDAQFEPGEATVIIRANSLENVYLLEELQDLAQKRGAVIHFMIGGRSHMPGNWKPANSVYEDKSISQIVPGLTESDVYICGSTNWAKNVIDDLKTAGVGNHQLHWERFNW